jgi:hypothetical protein
MPADDDRAGVMHRIAEGFAICTAVALMAVAPLDSAVIIGSTNGHDYQIVVNSDGSASISSASTGTKAF